MTSNLIKIQQVIAYKAVGQTCVPEDPWCDVDRWVFVGEANVS